MDNHWPWSGWDVLYSSCFSSVLFDGNISLHWLDWMEPCRRVNYRNQYLPIQHAITLDFLIPTCRCGKSGLSAGIMVNDFILWILSLVVSQNLQMRFLRLAETTLYTTAGSQQQWSYKRCSDHQPLSMSCICSWQSSTCLTVHRNARPLQLSTLSVLVDMQQQHWLQS